MAAPKWKEITLYLLCGYENHEEREGNDGPGSCRPAWSGTVVYAVAENLKVIDGYIKKKDGSWSGCSRKSIQVLKKDGVYYPIPEAVTVLDESNQTRVCQEFAGILNSQQMVSQRAEALAAFRASQTPRSVSQ